MINLGEDRFLVEPGDDLPDLRVEKHLFLDGETTGFSDKVEAFHPYHGHRLCGFAVTADADPRCWYVPVRHRGASNVPESKWKPWARHLLERAPAWVNHNVKFDAHFMHVDGVDRKGPMIDTVVLSQTIDTDRWSHGLKPLCRDWGIDPMDEAREVEAYLKGAKSKDFAVVPPDVLGRYAMRDVSANRKLFSHVVRVRPPDLEEVWNLEVEMTSVLFRMESIGFMVDDQQLRIEKVKCLSRMLPICDRLHKITGVEFTNSSDWIHDQLCTQRGLPVLRWTESKQRDANGKKMPGGPSFDAEALQLYLGHPAVITNPEAMEIVKLIQAYRSDSTYLSLFVDSLLEKHVDGVVHPSYKQLIRTGRMAGSDPNTQQFEERAKALVHPRPGYAFVSADASQIEFRIIAHYCRDEETIRAYNEDPSTDYHQWVADKVGMKRSPAKTLNFSMAYGAGRAKVEQQLAMNPDIMESVMADVEAYCATREVSPEKKRDMYAAACAARASAIYEEYHERFPGIKRCMTDAATLCRQRGWVQNAYKYRRHLPAWAAHKGFNSIVQGGAMHVIKERMVALSPLVREYGAEILINVHDEILFEVPVEHARSDEWRRWLDEQLCAVEKKFRVPFKWDIGWSEQSWKEAVA